MMYGISGAILFSWSLEISIAHAHFRTLMEVSDG